MSGSVEHLDRDGSGGSRPGSPDWSVLILTGGTSRRLGQDKATATVAGIGLLDRLLMDLPEAVPVVVVGPRPARPPRAVTVRREDPPGGGPVAGLAAGLPTVSTPVVVVFATDMPFAAQHAERLARSLSGSRHDAVIPVDGQGRQQPLCAAYRTAALRRALSALGEPGGRSLRSLTAQLSVGQPHTGLPPSDLLDIDTRSDLLRARRRAIMTGTPTREAPMIEEWIDAVRLELDLPTAMDIDGVLDVAKDVAHGVERPAAPLTTYLLGCAVARGADPAQAAAKIRELAAGWRPEG